MLQNEASVCTGSLHCWNEQPSGTLTADQAHSPSNAIASDARRLACQLEFAAALLYLAFLPLGIYSDDANSMPGVAESIITRHNLIVAAGLGIPGRGYFSAACALGHNRFSRCFQSERQRFPGDAGYKRADQPAESCGNIPR